MRFLSKKTGDGMSGLRRFFIADSGVMGDTAVLTGQEFSHMVSVLRHREGDSVLLLTGSGEELTARIVSIQKNCAHFAILDRRVSGREPGVQLDLFQAVCKGEKMEWIVQKSVELGIGAIHPFTSAFTVAKDNDAKTERLNKIATEAVKQCCRAVLVPVSDTLTFSQMTEKLADYDALLFCYESESKQGIRAALKGMGKPSRAAVIIGSEGGFSEEEASLLVGRGARSVGLGSRILRAETAAVAAIAVCMYEWGELGGK